MTMSTFRFAVKPYFNVYLGNKKELSRPALALVSAMNASMFSALKGAEISLAARQITADDNSSDPRVWVTDIYTQSNGLTLSAQFNRISTLVEFVSTSMTTANN